MATRNELGYAVVMDMSMSEALKDARARTLELALDLDDEQWMGPRLAIVNPMLWELGHVAWFQERWVLRHACGRAPIRADGDSLYDSSRIAHDTRWDLPLPDRQATLAYMNEVLERTLATADGDPYFRRLALFHEDMHGEAFTYTRQTLAYPPPRFAAERTLAPAGALPGDVEVPGGRYVIGAVEGRDPFVFDNEKWAHEVELAPFRIARAPVTNAEYAAYVNATNAPLPVHWRRAERGFEARRWNRWEPIAPDEPVSHVSWHEANAWCAWAGRRLPTEAEWEIASTSSDKRHANLDGRFGGTVDVAAFAEGESRYGCRQMIGNVWEWTATRFAPYPGFVVDPYEEYSEPWFATPHIVLRGGCWATRARLLRSTWRNFYPPDRRDVLAGFRTCAIERRPSL